MERWEAVDLGDEPVRQAGGRRSYNAGAVDAAMIHTIGYRVVVVPLVAGGFGSWLVLVGRDGRKRNPEGGGQR